MSHLRKRHQRYVQTVEPNKASTQIHLFNDVCTECTDREVGWLLIGGVVLAVIAKRWLKTR